MADDSGLAHGGDQSVDPAAVMEEVTRRMRGWLAQRGGGAALAALVDQGLTRAAEETATVAGRTLTVLELLKLLSEQTSLFDSGEPLRLTSGHTPAGLLVSAWRAIVHRQTKAAMLLVRQEYPHEALTNARTALEHAALLAAADRARRAGELTQFVAAVNKAGHDQAERHLKILIGLDQESGGEHRAALQDAKDVLLDVKPTVSGKRWWDGEPGTLFKTLPDGGVIAYSFYKVCSENTHAGSGSAMPYLAPTAIGGPVIQEPIALHTAEMLAMLTWCLVQADITMDGFIVEPHLQRRHVELLDLD